MLKLLRRLRQRVKGPWLTAVGHQKLPGTLWRGLEERRSFDFQETLIVHVTARRDGHLRAQPQIANHLRASQVEVAVLQAQFLVHLVGHLGVVHLEGQDCRGVQDGHRLDLNLHLAAQNLSVAGALGPDPNLALDLNHRLGVKLGSHVEEGRRQVRRIEHGLGPPFPVTEVDKEDTAEVASGVDPTGQDDRAASIRGAEFIAMVRALHAKIRSHSVDLAGIFKE